MTRWTRLGRMVQWLLIFSLVAVTAQALTPALNTTSATGQKLILNVYTDKTGKALVTGYVEDVHGLPFLNTSQYKYDNDTSQLYALTDSLTRKDGDLWTLNFASQGYYDDYHVTFFLPSDIKLQKINSTSGLEYLLSASNQSLEADIQGYEVHDPAVAIAYQQPLQETQNGGSDKSSLYSIVGVALLLAIGSASFLIAKRRRASSQSSPASLDTAHEISEPPTERVAAKPPEDILLEAEAESSEREPEAEGSQEEIFTPSTEPDPLNLSEDEHQEAEKPEKIQVSSEMSAVLQTLTPRERAIMEALIEHAGRMTQADLRYETQTPKSSLSGILLSLERRKLITKKEWGRTNVIELSEWFLS